VLRAAAAAPFFALAALFASRSWDPLANGYFASNRDSPDGVYLTTAGIGLSVAALLAAMGLAIVWAWFRRNGGFLVIAGLAILASLLPLVLFKWTGSPDTWPWPHFVEEGIGWLQFDPLPRAVGVAIQLGLAVVAAAAAAAHVRIRRSRPRGSSETTAAPY